MVVGGLFLPTGSLLMLRLVIALSIGRRLLEYGGQFAAMWWPRAAGRLGG